MPLSSLPACQGLISCLYSSCEENHAAAAAAAASSSQDTKTTKEILSDRIVNFYEEAFNRLPWEDMPDDINIVDLIDTGGLCVGLLDPVSNIILNTVSLLPPNFQSVSQSSPRPTKFIAKSTLYILASRSYIGLVGFLLDYFGCLTEEQASRYLRWADGDLALAVLLVEYDLYSAGGLPDAGSERTQASLKVAVLRAGHPAPDRLVQLTASVFPLHQLNAVKDILLARHTELTIEDVLRLKRLLQDSTTPNAYVTLLSLGGFVTHIPKQTVDKVALFSSETSDLGDGYITTTVKPVGKYLSSMRSCEEMESRKLACLEEAYSLKYRLKECGESCEHLQSLKMRLLDTVHSFYLNAISVLPCQGANWIIRSILVAGHCYGIFDPVANIIINSIWHNRLCPLPVADRIEKYDILDTLSVLRTEVRSLEGMIEVARPILDTSSTKEAVKTLCRIQCDITKMLQAQRNVMAEWDWRAERGLKNSFPRPLDPLLIGAVAAQHPLPAALALFHKQLAEDIPKLEKLHSLVVAYKMRGDLLSVHDIEQISHILDEVFTITPEVQSTLQPQVPQLHKEAHAILLTKRSEYECHRKYIWSKVTQLLDKYAAQHPWERRYMPVVICGLEKCGNVYAEAYRVNFMASYTYGNTHENRLFFAEFWMSYGPGDSKPDVCCPLNPPYNGGRCYYGKISAKKILYPDSADYFMCDVTAHGIGTVDSIIDADFVYFDSERDAEFVKKVNSYYAEKSLLRPAVLASGTKMFGSFTEHYPCPNG